MVRKRRGGQVRHPNHPEPKFCTNFMLVKSFPWPGLLVASEFPRQQCQGGSERRASRPEPCAREPSCLRSTAYNRRHIGSLLGMVPQRPVLRSRKRATKRCVRRGKVPSGVSTCRHCYAARRIAGGVEESPIQRRFVWLDGSGAHAATRRTNAIIGPAVIAERRVCRLPGPRVNLSA